MALIITEMQFFFDSTDTKVTKDNMLDSFQKQGFHKVSEVKDGQGGVIAFTMQGQPQLIINAPVQKEADIFRFDPVTIKGGR